MVTKNVYVFLITFATGLLSLVLADPKALQDFCVADLKSQVEVNGYPCKNPKTVVADDFYSCALAKPVCVNETTPSAFTPCSVQQIPGFNTLGLTLGRLDYAPGNGSPPHYHPRATEVIYVIEGDLEAGFVSTANVHFTKKLKKGEIFVIPQGLVHWSRNVGTENAVVLCSFDSQSPGIVGVMTTLFTANPPVPPEVLSKAMKVDKKVVEEIVCKIAPPKPKAS